MIVKFDKIRPEWLTEEIISGIGRASFMACCKMYDDYPELKGTGIGASHFGWMLEALGLESYEIDIVSAKIAKEMYAALPIESQNRTDIIMLKEDGLTVNQLADLKIEAANKAKSKIVN